MTRNLNRYRKKFPYDSSKGHQSTNKHYGHSLKAERNSRIYGRISKKQEKGKGREKKIMGYEDPCQIEIILDKKGTQQGAVRKRNRSFRRCNPSDSIKGATHIRRRSLLFPAGYRKIL